MATQSRTASGRVSSRFVWFAVTSGGALLTGREPAECVRVTLDA